MEIMIFESRNSTLGFICGAIGGVSKYIMQINDFAGFGIAMTKAGLTALICGFLGVAGKWLFEWMKKRIKGFLKRS